MTHGSTPLTGAPSAGPHKSFETAMSSARAGSALPAKDKRATIAARTAARRVFNLKISPPNGRFFAPTGKSKAMPFKK